MKKITTFRSELAAAFASLRFEEKTHSYSHPLRPEGFISVSQWCKQFYTETDMEALAERQTAAGKWCHKAAALGTWDWERHRGTLSHAGLQMWGEYAMGSEELARSFARAEALREKILRKVPMTDGARRCFDAGQAWLRFLLNQGYQIVAVELKVCCLKRGVAGTIDLLLMAPDGRLLVVDWKTCRRLWLRAFADEITGQIPHLLGPFAAFEDCKLTRYAIQLPTYRLILDEAGFQTHGSILVHLPPEGYEAVAYATTGKGLMLPDMLPQVTEAFTYQLAA